MKKILILTALLCLSIGTWAAEATITATNGSTYASAYYLPADGTAITAVVGAGAKSITYDKGAKITVDKKNNPSATITFTIPSGVTITSFKVNGTNQNNTAYDLDGTSVTFGTALTSLSKTSSMVFTLTCTDTNPSSTSNRNTTITSIDLVYSTGGGGGGCTAPTFSAPSSATVYGGQEKSATKALAVTVSNSGAMTSLSYQWYSDTNADATGGTALTTSGEIAKGTQGATYSSTTSSEFSTSLYYYCVVTNTCGVGNVASTTSYPFTVTTKDCVSPGLSISLKP